MVDARGAQGAASIAAAPGPRSERRATLPDVDDGALGVYVHLPFCERICPYCDFAVVRAHPLGEAVETRYLDALLAELALRRDDFAGRPLRTLYLGGGTPALLRPESVARLLGAIRDAFPPDAEPPETTLEVNPSTLERERLPAFRAVGVTRLSVGVQSFDDRLLHRLGRAHRAEASRATLRAARAAGFEKVSLDLLFGVPGQSVAGFVADLEEALAFAPPHVSVYQLTVEPGTPYATAVRRGQLAPPDEEESVAMFQAAEARLGAAGLRRYEISSYARPGAESLHNRRYWARLPVLGLGMGAWSTDPPARGAPFGARRANVRELPVYLERVEAGVSPGEPAERLDARTARGEAVFLALRTAEGLAARGFAREFGAPPRRFYGEAIAELTAERLLAEAEDGSLRLTPRGVLLSDSVFERFV